MEDGYLGGLVLSLGAVGGASPYQSVVMASDFFYNYFLSVRLQHIERSIWTLDALVVKRVACGRQSGQSSAMEAFLCFETNRWGDIAR